MTWFTGIVVYALVWWTVLFAVLPLWTNPVTDPDEKTHFRGAPERPLLLRKVLVTTLVSLGGQLFGPKEIDKVASLPTREQALAQLIGVIQAPIAKLVRTLAEPHAKLVRTIAAVRDQKQAAAG